MTTNKLMIERVAEELYYSIKSYEKSDNRASWELHTNYIRSKYERAAEIAINTVNSYKYSDDDLLATTPEGIKAHDSPLYFHGSITTTQGDIRDPSNWKTTEKYPLELIPGCKFQLFDEDSNQASVFEIKENNGKLELHISLGFGQEIIKHNVTNIAPEIR